MLRNAIPFFATYQKTRLQFSRRRPVTDHKSHTLNGTSVGRHKTPSAFKEFVHFLKRHTKNNN